MTLPTSGPLSLTDIQTEFGGSNPIGLNEYYAGGGLVPAGTSGTNGAVPSSGQIAISNFYGTASYYGLTKSLRFRSSATAYLNRTPASTTNRQIFTLSNWVKRGVLSARQHIFVSANPVVNTGGQQEFQIVFDSSDKIQITGGVSGVSLDFDVVTTQVFRDPSSWYHVVVAVDTTQATASNRIKLYVNGVQVTAFSTSSYPTQNYNTSVNLINFSHRFGGSGTAYFDGYFAEINFIDGQALTPSSFGAANANLGGMWQPLKYTGSYGTNGFYLPFTNTTSTTTLVADSSGNGNNWTPNNISLTAGVTYDSMTDVPTLTNATTANYAVINPINQSGQTITNGNLTTLWSATAAGNRSSFAMSADKWYWEVTMTDVSNQINTGIVRTDSSLTVDLTVVGSNAVIYVGLNGNRYINGSVAGYGAAYVGGDIIGVAVDITNNTIIFYKNGVSQGTITGLSLSGFSWYAATGNANNQANQKVDYNFGQRPFSYTPPTGYVALNTFNI
jgi:hypothetical protein